MARGKRYLSPLPSKAEVEGAEFPYSEAIRGKNSLRKQEPALKVPDHVENARRQSLADVIAWRRQYAHDRSFCSIETIQIGSCRELIKFVDQERSS